MAPCTTLQYLRKPKIFDMSIFDWITSLFIAAILGFSLRIHGILNWFLFFSVWTLFGVVVHSYFGIHTMLGYYLGLNPPPVRIECT